jgi:hypothetical protein
MVGGTVLPDEPMDVMASGSWKSPVNVLIGTNTNEGDTFVTGGLRVPLPGPLASAAYDLIFGVENAKRVRARVRMDDLVGGGLCVHPFITFCAVQPRYDPSNYPFLNGTWALSNGEACGL